MTLLILILLLILLSVVTSCSLLFLGLVSLQQQRNGHSDKRTHAVACIYRHLPQPTVGFELATRLE